MILLFSIVHFHDQLYSKEIQRPALQEAQQFFEFQIYTPVNQILIIDFTIFMSQETTANKRLAAIQDRYGTAIYVGHIPYAMEEKQLKTFFAQYGKVTKVKLARSKKTANSKGFGFVQFVDAQAARIAAQSINGYMINGKIMVGKVLQQNVFKYPLVRKKYLPIDWRKRFRMNRNRQLSTEEQKKIVENLLSKQQKKRQKLQEMGIEYDWPGFAKMVE